VINGYNIIAGAGALPRTCVSASQGPTAAPPNIHEVMCFQASPQTSSQSSASGNQKQSAPVVTGTQVLLLVLRP